MSKSEGTPLPGKELAGRFKLAEKIGEGGMGAVYKATHTQMGRTCAIKLLLPGVDGTEVSAERFKREAQLASRIDNPHAVTIFDFGEAEGGTLFLVMEFVHGRQLGQVIHGERPLASERILHITTQIAEALSAAHSLGIVHRDLKPDNIMITRKGDDPDYVKVLDFGIARTFDDSGAGSITKTGFVLGTPYYMSPEQLSGDRLDARSDVYSLALIVYEMFSGRLPFEGENSQAVMIKRLISEPVPLRQVAASVSKDVESVVMKALTRNREERTPGTLVFAEELKKALINTQMLSGRPTNRVAEEESGRSTLAIASSDTDLDLQVNASRPGSQEAPQQPDSPGGMPTVEHVSQPISRDTPSENKAQPLPDHSPSSYVTRPALDSSGPTPAQPTTTPDPSTFPLGSEKSNRPAGNFQPTPNQPTHSVTKVSDINAYAPQQPVPISQPPYTQGPAQPTAPVYGHPTASEAKKSRTGLIIASLAIVLLIAAGAGIYFFTNTFTGRKIPTSDVQTSGSGATTNPTKSSDEIAAGHYENGKRHQDQARMLINTGSLTDAGEENKKAIEEYSKAVSLKSTYPEAHENLGVAHYNVGNLSVALVELKTAIDQYTQGQRRPTAQVMTNYGLVLYDLKRYEDAAAAFKQGYDIDGSDADLLAFQGFALHLSGQTQNAKALYRSYLSASPKGQYADAVTAILAGRAQPPEASGN